MSIEEREILERAVRSLSEQTAAASAIVDEAMDSGLDGSYRPDANPAAFEVLLQPAHHLASLTTGIGAFLSSPVPSPASGIGSPVSGLKPSSSEM